jgi:hypothetical protein
MASRRGLVLALLLSALILPSAAQAAVRCVPAGAPGCTSAHATIASAVSAASDDDTIRIAAGTYNESISTTKRLSFVGAGAGATTISPASGPALALSRGGSIGALRAVGANGSSGSAAVVLQPDVDGTFGYSVTNVVGVGGNGTTFLFGVGGTGLSVTSGSAARVVHLTLSGGSFSAGSSNGVQGTALDLSGPGLTATVAGTSAIGPSPQGGDGFVADGGSTVDVTGLTAQGHGAVKVADSTVTIRRSSMQGVGRGVSVYDAASGTPTSVTLLDDLITATPVSATSASALAVFSSAGSAAAVSVRSSTILARGVDPEFAVIARPSLGLSTATIDLRNSIARLEAGAEPGEADVAADRGALSVSHSDFVSRLELNGGTIAGLANAILSADPLFVPGAFALQRGSTLIDRGDPAAVSPGERDLAGNARFAGAAPDIGAYEYQPAKAPGGSPPPAPDDKAPKLGKVSMTNTVFAPIAIGAACAAGRAGCLANTASTPHRARGRVKRGTIFRYALSEPAVVTIAVDRRARGVRARARARGRVRCMPLSHRRARSKHKGRPCTRWLHAGRLEALQTAGTQSVPFGGRFKGRALKPGRYRARVRAKDGDGARSKERRLAFRIVRAR